MTKQGNTANPHLRVCEKGHRYFKSSDCPTCPVCEAANRPQTGFLSLLAAPARRALQGEKILTLEKLAGYTKAEILRLHGVGASTLPILQKALAEKGFNFKES